MTLVPDELVVEGEQVRQAGADASDTAWIAEVRATAEQSLYFFAKTILGLTRLAPHLHQEVCGWLTEVPPYRKLLLLPRDFLKTSILRALMLHLLIQPQHKNRYFPGCWADGCGMDDCTDPAHRFDGRNTRILYAGETDRNAEKQLGWAMAKLDGGKLLRAFWPDRVWADARKQSKKWHAQAVLIPRDRDYPEASIEAIGVGGAVTGRHYDVLLKDDLATIRAANSPLVMELTIEWNKATRALMDDPDRSLEFMAGTRWAPLDVWSDIQRTDPTVSVMCRSILENGAPLWPERFPMKTIDRLRSEEGSLFPLIRMNSTADPTLSDFDLTRVRTFTVHGPELEFVEDERDFLLATRGLVAKAPLGTQVSQEFRGRSLREFYDQLGARNEYLRLKAS